MPYDLANLRLSEMTQLGATLRAIGTDAGSLEETAERVVNLLYDECIDPTTQAKACALVRLYYTVDYAKLPPHLQEFGARLLPGSPLPPETRCLTLLGTAGHEPRWRSRKTSAGHQSIPLPSAEVIHAIPMVSQLLTQLGIPIGTVLRPDPGLVLETEQHTYNVFFVPEAEGSPYIPAQENFVVPYNIRSVLGFGGLLPSGDVYAVLMFAQVPISKPAAEIFRNAAMNLKLALLPFLGGPVFQDRL